MRKSDFVTKRFAKRYATQFFVTIGVIASVLGIYDVFDPNRITGTLASVLSIALVIVLAGLVALYFTWPRPVEHKFSKPNTQVRVIEGDLLEQTSHVMIGMADTFDTQIHDPEVIDSKSVQGQFLLKVFGGDRPSFDAALDSALDGLTTEVVLNKRAGKVERYPLGTVATVRKNGQTYFCLAYTKMDASNNAHATIGGIWNCLYNLWDEVRRESNGGVVAVPVIGGGQARISQHLPAQDAIRLTALSFVLASREQKICDGLDIIVREGGFDQLNAPELQAFLRSLDEA